MKDSWYWIHLYILNPYQKQKGKNTIQTFFYIVHQKKSIEAL